MSLKTTFNTNDKASSIRLLSYDTFRSSRTTEFVNLLFASTSGIVIGACKRVSTSTIIRLVNIQFFFYLVDFIPLDMPSRCYETFRDT